jgi:hypothetical protein
MTYDDLNDAAKTYALSLARSMAAFDLPGMQQASDAATAAGLSDVQKAQVGYIVQYQDTPAVGEAVQQVQSQISGAQDGAPGRTYDDFNDNEKTYANSLARSMATFDLPGMQQASDAATAAGLSDVQKAQVAYIVQYQDTPAIGEIVNQARAQVGITSQDGVAAPARTFDDLNQDEQAYALDLARPMAAADVVGMVNANDAATAAGLSDAQKAEVFSIVQNQLTPATGAASGNVGWWSSTAPSDAEAGGGVVGGARVGETQGGPALPSAIDATPSEHNGLSTSASPPGPASMAPPDPAILSDTDRDAANYAALDVVARFQDLTAPGATATPASFAALSDNQKSYADFMASRILNIFQAPPDASMQLPSSESRPSPSN